MVGQVLRAVPDVAVEQVLHAGPVRREQLLPAGQQGLGDRVAGALRVGEQVGQRRAGGGIALVGSAQLQLVDDLPERGMGDPVELVVHGGLGTAGGRREEVGGVAPPGLQRLQHSQAVGWPLPGHQVQPGQVPALPGEPVCGPYCAAELEQRRDREAAAEQVRRLNPSTNTSPRFACVRIVRGADASAPGCSP